MSFDYTIVEITKDNIAEHPQVICYINPKHPQYSLKIEWLLEQFTKGLRIKLLYINEEKAPLGFIEYTPGEQCWRAVNAAGYLFIHCLWTSKKKYQHRGVGALLLSEVEKDAGDTLGMAAIASDKAFMATKEIFLKNGFVITATSGKEQLVVKKRKEGPNPTINDWEGELKKQKGLAIVYSRQCPWVARFIEEIKPTLKDFGLNPRIVELTTAKQAQKAPSLYGIFSLVYNGKLLADRYISVTRFKNIVNKELNP